MPKQETACRNCGDALFRYPSKIKQDNFCSRDCMVAYRNRTGYYKKENHPQWSGGPVEVTCEHCGKAFRVKASQLARGRGKYCSKKCMRDAGSVKHTCEVCGKSFRMKRSHSEMGHGRYCSIECRSAGYIERGVFAGENHPKYIDGKSHTAEYVRRASHRRRVQKRRNGGDYTIEEWEALCEKYDNRCLACGQTGVLLTVDHVVPVVKGGSNDISNLQPLCKSCNSAKHDKVIDYR